MPNPTPSTDIVTARELAAEHRTTKQTVLAWHRRGLIPATVCAGRVIRFDRAAVAAALAAAGNPKPAAR